MYSSKITQIFNKIKTDLSKCFDENKTGIKCSNIKKILYFHTSSNLSPKQYDGIQNIANQHGVQLELYGIDRFANILFNDHKYLIKEYLGIPISTDQIFTKDNFIAKYDNAPTAAPFKINFMFREKEINDIKSAFSEVNAILIFGDAGVGKTKLALEAAEQYAKENNMALWVIRNNN